MGVGVGVGVRVPTGVGAGVAARPGTSSGVRARDRAARRWSTGAGALSGAGSTLAVIPSGGRSRTAVPTPSCGSACSVAGAAPPWGVIEPRGRLMSSPDWAGAPGSSGSGIRIGGAAAEPVIGGGEDKDGDCEMFEGNVDPAPPGEPVPGIDPECGGDDVGEADPGGPPDEVSADNDGGDDEPVLPDAEPPLPPAAYDVPYVKISQAAVSAGL